MGKTSVISEPVNCLSIVCVTPEQASKLISLDTHVSTHLYFCCRCYQLFQQINPHYLNLLERTENEWDQRFRQCLANSDKDSYLLQIRYHGLPHLSDVEIVNFNLLEDDFDPDILVGFYEHLAECFRCRSQCRKLKFDDFRRVYPSYHKDSFVREIYTSYSMDAEIVFGDFCI